MFKNKIEISALSICHINWLEAQHNTVERQKNSRIGEIFFLKAVLLLVELIIPQFFLDPIKTSKGLDFYMIHRTV